MTEKIKQTIKVSFFLSVMPFLFSTANGIEAPNVATEFVSTGVQTRIGKVTKIRVEAGETRFQIDSCPENPIVPGFFTIASTNPDKLDITRLLIAAMTFNKEVKVYNTAYGDDINLWAG